MFSLSRKNAARGKRAAFCILPKQPPSFCPAMAGADSFSRGAKYTPVFTALPLNAPIQPEGLLIILALLVCDAARGLAGRLAGGLAFAAAAGLEGLVEVSCVESLYSFHGGLLLKQNNVV